MPSHWNNDFLIHRLVEMDIMGGQTVPELCEALGVSAPSLSKMRDTDEYKRMMDKAKRDSERQTQARLKESIVLTKTKLATFANEAIDILIELAAAGKPEVRLKAACEILDRDGRFAKVSRMMNVRQGEDGAPMLPEDTAAEILSALSKVKPSSDSIQ
jgi:hypothetical protein